MSVKIGSSGISDVVIGSGGGKTNINKIIVGNADNTGTVVWENGPTPVPTTDGYWSGTVYDDKEITYSNYFSNQYWDVELDYGSNTAYIYFNKNKWIINMSGEIPIEIPGNGSEKHLVYTYEYPGYDVDIQWREEE